MDTTSLTPQTPSPGLNPAQRRLLRGVSRSFDLSIRLLPSALQAPVAVGYLLARATDTVADTSTLPQQERQVLLDLMSAWIADTEPGGEVHRELLRLTRHFAAQQTDPNEQALMQALPDCLPLLHQLPPQDQSSVRQVLGHITRGQQLDMARFGPGLQALQTEAELDEYTWLVAGCVGEFWTELCGRHLPGYSPLPQSDMVRMGRTYGMGLQRLNIVRDAGADLSAGRCYWPVETLAKAGLTPSMLAEAVQADHPDTLQALAPLYGHWLEHTQAQLAEGMRYALALQPLRLRLASALPALVGARTIALLRRQGPAALRHHVKMPRSDMRALLWRIALGLGSRAALGRQFQKMSEASSP